MKQRKNVVINHRPFFFRRAVALPHYAEQLMKNDPSAIMMLRECDKERERYERKN